MYDFFFGDPSYEGRPRCDLNLRKKEGVEFTVRQCDSVGDSS